MFTGCLCRVYHMSMSARKKSTNMTLSDDVLAALDRIVGLLGPKSNRTDVVERCVRYAARVVEREGKQVLQSPEAEDPVPSIHPS